MTDTGDEQPDRSVPDFIRDLGLGEDADERTIRRVYARQLKQIDQETQAEAFQALRRNYDAALQWATWQRQQNESTAPTHPGEPSDAVTSVTPSQPAPWVAEADGPSTPAKRLDQSEQKARTALNLLSDSWHRHPPADHDEAAQRLRSSLDDADMVDMDAQFIFEWGIASQLASGWRPGHEYLFPSAMDQFQWRDERIRLHRLGRAGQVIDAAITELEMHDMLPWAQQMAQRDVIRQLRLESVPGDRALLRQMPSMELAARAYPHWLHVMTCTANIDRWRDRTAQMPKWRRWITRPPRVATSAGASTPPPTRWLWVASGISMFVALMSGLSHPPDPSRSARPANPSIAMPLDGAPRTLLADGGSRGGLDALLRQPPQGPLSTEMIPYALPTRPVYPSAAKRAGMQGRIVVRVRVGLDGRAVQAEIQQSSGHRLLDDAAVDAARRAVYTPAKNAKGSPVEASYSAPFNFTLDDQQAPSARTPGDYGQAVRDAVRSHIAFAGNIQGNPTAEVHLQVTPDGRIVMRTLSQSSGLPAWDTAVLRAVDRTAYLPLDRDGKVPPSLIISFRPHP